MRLLRLSLPLLFVLACGGAARSPGTPKVLADVDEKGVGLDGYDPMSYWNAGQPADGDEAQTVSHAGATYFFATAESKAAFTADPAKHAPRFGGYCAFALSQNRLQAADPTAWEIYDGKLLLFTNAVFKDQFAGDKAGFLAKAEANWPALVETHGK
jgi:YHS domain-containing protein